MHLHPAAHWIALATLAAIPAVIVYVVTAADRVRAKARRRLP